MPLGVACLDIIACIQSEKEIDRRKRQLDVAIYLPNGTYLIGAFRVYNSNNVDFQDGELYSFHVNVAGMNANVPLNQVASPFVTQRSAAHFIGDIDPQSIIGPIPAHLTGQCSSSITLAGVAARLPPPSSDFDGIVDEEDDAQSSFDMTVSQYIGALGDSWKAHAHLPVRVTIPTNARFKPGSKPIPAHGAMVFVHGYVTHVETGDDDLACRFFVLVDTISKLGSGGPAALDAEPVRAPGEPPLKKIKTTLSTAVVGASPRKRQPPPPPIAIPQTPTPSTSTAAIASSGRVSPPSPCTPCSSASPCPSSQTAKGKGRPATRSTKRQLPNEDIVHDS
ncbi:hypothetical protein BD626DRAFT_638056 [Schizophyllum amplum]|uniref:Uncharacterized protein n=1 Tax=Schizophyllum amplum TaxID=97359 RepID=A0A550BRZ3_9AGAR|nr:hypothetical protein BD626DRAFT_638056 [Auriculariopsis ampla]